MKSFSLVTLCFFTVISGKLFSQIEQSDNAEKIFEKVDIDATFPGGEKAWTSFLIKHLNANVPVDKGAPAGKYTVWIQFIVDKEGNVTALTPLTSQGYGMEEEVMRILKLVPKWSPASQDGRYVKAYRKQPVTFIVEDESFEVKITYGQYIFAGINNPITVYPTKANPENLSVTISQGTITGSDGSYLVRVNNADGAIMTIYNKKKLLGRYSFSVTYPNAADSTNPLIRKEKAENLIWASAGINPEYPGGEKEWTKFLKENVNSSIPISNGAPKGEYTVWIFFLVDKNGQASDWDTISNPGFGMKEEALRVVKKVSSWLPAVQSGQKVKCFKSVAITFKVG
jgi:hypothetical protein